MYLTKSDIKGLVTSEQKYTTLPSLLTDSIFESKKLSSTEKLVMFYFLNKSYLGQGDEIRITLSISTISKGIGKSAGSTSETINSLVKKGWLFQETSELRSKAKKILLKNFNVTAAIKAPKNKTKTPSTSKKNATANTIHTPSPSPFGNTNITADQVRDLNIKLSQLDSDSEEYQSTLSLLDSISLPNDELINNAGDTEGKASPPIPHRKISHKLKSIIIEKVNKINESEISVPKSDIYNQFIFAITKGTFRGSNPLKAIRSIYNLMKSGEWKTPIGYQNYRDDEFDKLNSIFG